MTLTTTVKAIVRASTKMLIAINGNGVDNKSMKTITKIYRNDFDNDDSRTTTLMIV